MFDTVNENIYKDQKRSSMSIHQAYTKDALGRNSNPFLISSVDYEDDSITKSKMSNENKNDNEKLSKEIILDFDSKYIKDHYTILKKLGQGSFGCVY